MNTLDYGHVLGIVYQHFVLDSNTPGALCDGLVRYHQYDECGYDHPCPIGLFDCHKKLDNQSGFGDHGNLEVAELPQNVLADVFGVDRITPEDINVLSSIQEKHDLLVRHYAQGRNLGLFRMGMAMALESIARDHNLQEVLASTAYPVVF